MEPRSRWRLLFLLCGLPGAGKTTLARRLERERGALRLTPDEWMDQLGIDLFDEPRRNAIESLQWEVAARALALGINVILDWGFWSRAERDDFRRRAARLGADAEIAFLDVPLDQLLRRLEARNAELPRATARIDATQLDAYCRVFQPPTSDELARRNEEL